MPTPTTGFKGYDISLDHSEDVTLTHVTRGSAGGEYLRRFWHPVALSSEVTTLPSKIRILGEDLIVFRDKSGNAGLMHRQCCHRGASLEYAVCEDKGIRCCYHGWLFDLDGTILETPGEPIDSKPAERLRSRLKQGAYPTREIDGILFAYLGAPDNQPGFPVYDTFDLPGNEKQPYGRDYPCNWLQITENAMDPVHAVFLHARVSGPQFADTWGQLSVKEYYERKAGLFYTNARRVDDNVWVRIHEVIFPNLTHAGAVLTMDGKSLKYFGRNTFTRWVVPVDNENSRVIAWANFGELTDPSRPEWRTTEGIDVIEGGMPRDRSEENCQQFPGDYEAFIGQGPITAHTAEHLSGSDRGVVMFRTRLRSAIKGLQNGEEPFQPSNLGPAPIPTYCGDSVIKVQISEGSNQEAELLEVSRIVIAAIRSADSLKNEQRYNEIVSRLKSIESE